MALENSFKFSKPKTQCMHFCQLRGLHNDPVFKLNDVEIPVIFDKKLSFIPHINYLKANCHQALHLLFLLHILAIAWRQDCIVGSVYASRDVRESIYLVAVFCSHLITRNRWEMYIKQSVFRMRDSQRDKSNALRRCCLRYAVQVPDHTLATPGGKKTHGYELCFCRGSVALCPVLNVVGNHVQHPLLSPPCQVSTGIPPLYASCGNFALR